MSEIKFNVAITNEAISYIRTINNNSFLKYTPTKFSISEQVGEFSANRTYDSMYPVWIFEDYSSVVNEGTDMIAHSITIPPNASRSNKKIGEMYFLAERDDGTPFLFAIIQPETPFEWRRNLIYNFTFCFRLKNTNIQDVCNVDFHYPEDVEIHNRSTQPHLNVIGSLLNLQTKTQESIVDAINELVTWIGDLSQLKTTKNQSFVSIVNELYELIEQGGSGGGTDPNLQYETDPPELGKMAKLTYDTIPSTPGTKSYLTFVEIEA